MDEPADIVELLKADREAGTKALIDGYRDRLLALAKSLVKDTSAAEDLVFRTIERAVGKIDSCRGAESFPGWIRTILINTHRKDCRSLASKGVVFTDEIPDLRDNKAERAVTAGLEAASLRSAIERLPREMREAIVMHYFMDIPVLRMAKILAMPEGTVKSRLHYARLCLAGILETQGGKAAFGILAAVLLSIASLFAYFAMRPEVPTDWMTDDLVRVAEHRRLGAVESVSAWVYGRSGVTVSRRLSPTVENDGAVLMAPCAFEGKGVRVQATIQLLQIGDDIWGRVVDPESNGRLARLVTRVPTKDGEVSVGGIDLSYRRNAPDFLLRASFASASLSRRAVP